MSDNSFRFNAEKVFLTYSQTKKNMTPQWLLKNMQAKAGVSEYLISQESHKDGGKHLHAYFKFDKKLDTRSVTFFDVEYYRRGYHPNIQKPKSLFKLYDYIKKDKQYITNIDETRPAWLVILEDSEDLEELLTRIMWKVNRIDNYAGYRTLRDLADMKFSRTSVDKYIQEKLR